MCFVNAVLQLLVHSPSFRNLFKELCVVCDLTGKRAAGVPESGATPLADTMVTFLEEFKLKGKPQHAAGGELRDSFEPTYMYDAMKEKRRLKDLMVRSYYAT
jgi:hypothetical protein